MCSRTERTKKFVVLKCNMEQDFDVLIKKRKSRNLNQPERKSFTCHPTTISSELSSSTSTMMDKNIRDKKKCKIKSNHKCRKLHYYSVQVTLLYLIFQLLLIAHSAECRKIDPNYSIDNVNSDNNTNIFESSYSAKIDKLNYKDNYNYAITSNVSKKFEIQSHRHRRHQHHQRSQDPNVQSIQPKICHSLASSNSYLSSAFAHNFPLTSSSSSSRSSSSNNELSIENKLVLSPIVFQGTLIDFIMVGIFSIFKNQNMPIEIIILYNQI